MNITIFEAHQYIAYYMVTNHMHTKFWCIDKMRKKIGKASIQQAYKRHATILSFTAPSLIVATSNDNKS
jgi:hypothetical protein